MTKLKENVTRRSWRDVVFIAVAVALAPAATTVSGCVRQCEDTDLCGRPLEIRFVEELMVPGTYEITIDYDGSSNVCRAVLPEQSWLWGSCPPEDFPASGGHGGAMATAGAAGVAGTALYAGRSWDVKCSNNDIGPLYRCGLHSVVSNRLSPSTVTVTIHRDGEFVLSSTVTPEYRTYQPHKKGCGPVCREADETIETP
ncbi:MAG TPA: hypothetical protein PLU22_02515 [Polyangiaceae bacterium]|nr:hypothetical protein [Polyangiaceae bacterium]